MSLLKSIILGRSNGLRRKFFRSIFSQGVDTSPSSSYSAPAPDQGVVAGGSVKLEPPKDITPPEGYEVVLHKDALKEGEKTEVIIAGTAILIANVDGEFYALSSTWRDSPLVDGELTGSIITCPYNGWDFDVKDGSCKTNPTITLPTYPSLVKGDGVCVQI